MFGIKKIAIIGILAGLVSLALICERHKKLDVEHTPVPVTKEPEPSNELTSTFAENSEATRIALIQHCGHCHQSTLASHKPGAVAVFDLDAMEQWHDNLTEKNLEGLDRRTKNKSSVTDEQRAAIQEFLALKRAQLQ